MAIIELILGIVDLCCRWRFFICFGITMGIFAAMHNSFPDQAWVWFVTVPVVITGMCFGSWWQFRADRQ
jgi:NADH:ubiquinone oxidoreductase subunit 3 (subunit A)